MQAGKGAGKHAEVLSEIIMLLKRVGDGNAIKFFKELNFEKYTGEILGHWHKLAQRIDDVIEGLLRNARILIPDAMIARLRQIQNGVRELRRMGENMIPESLKEMNRRLKEIQKHIYEGDWHEIPSNLSSKTREAEGRLVEEVADGKKVKKWNLESPPFPPNADKVYRRVEGWPNLSDAVWAKYHTIATFSGPIRHVRLTPGTRIYRVLGPRSNKGGNFWLCRLPKDGSSWRKDCAVLESWNSNGRYVELIVPEGGIYAWEGRIASQIENEAGKTFGQFLPGGDTQIFIDFFFNEKNAKAYEEVLKLTPKETHWTDLSGINVPEKEVTVQKLGPNEIETKRGSTAAAEGQRAVHAQDRDDADKGKDAE
jgi:hypothetical protein